MKTILAPGAPWPVVKPAKPKIKRAPMPKKPTKSRQLEVDKNFEKWAAKNLTQEVL